MNSNDEVLDSDEHEDEDDDEGHIDANEIASDGEPEENVASGQEGSNQEEENNDDEDDRRSASPTNNNNNSNGEDDEEEARDAVDPTNPLDEDSMEAAQNLTQEDVFGEDLSDSSEDEDNVRRKRSQGGDLNGNREGDYDDVPEEQEEEEEEEQITVDTPQVTCDLGRDIQLVKLPTFMKMEPKPFDPQFINEDVREDDDEESKARMKLRVENTIRWRYSTNELGEMVRESNTRLVRWSDGSLSLHVGKEIYDVSKANIQNDHTHLFVRHQKSMQAQAVFRTKLSFRQHSNDSLAHLKLKFASKANPAPKVRVLSNIKAAIMDTDEMRRRDEQRTRAEERRRNQQLRQLERAANRDRNMSASYLEDRDDDDEDNEQESLSTIKKNVKKKKLQGDYRVEDSSDDNDGDDPEEKSIGQRATTTVKHRNIALSDDEESENEQQAKRKRVSPTADDAEEEEEEEAEEEQEQESD